MTEALELAGLIGVYAVILLPAAALAVLVILATPCPEQEETWKGILCSLAFSISSRMPDGTDTVPTKSEKLSSEHSTVSPLPPDALAETQTLGRVRRLHPAEPE